MQNNSIIFTINGKSVSVTPKENNRWTREDVESHLRLAGFDWDDDTLSVSNDEANEQVVLKFKDWDTPVEVVMPYEVYNIWVA